MLQYWWVPILVAIYVMQAFLSKKTNEESGLGAWFWTYVAVSLLSLWPVVAKFSKNLIFDALLYDMLMFLSFFGGLLLFGAAEKFNLWQWIGLIMAVAGYFLIRFFA